MKAQKGFVEGALPQLLLVLISFAVIAMIITNIFSGSGGIQEKLCLAVPFFCGTQTGIDYEVSARSTNAMACAIGSAFTGTKWPGGSGFTCEEFYDKTASTGGGGGGGGSGTADIVATGAASADEESLTINKIRNLKPLVLCDPEKKTCTVKNFVMPQEVTNWEERIAFWGDPDYLIYWGSFPQEEDTWNFKVNWIHYVIIGALAIIPEGKAIGLGFKAFLTGIKGGSKKLFAQQATKVLVKEASEATLETALKYSEAYWLKKGKKEITQAMIGKVKSASTAMKSGLTLSTQTEKELTDIFSKLTKKELKNLFSEAGKKIGTKEALKIVMREGMKDMLSKRISKFAAEPLKSTAILGGKYGVGLVALYALADSKMKKYEPIGNAIAIKSPGIKPEDMKIFELPQDLEGKPVVVAWNSEGGKTSIKNAHLVSPCYLKEFKVEKKMISCQDYSYNKSSKITTCGKGEIIEDPSKAPFLECGKYDISYRNYIDQQTFNGMFDTFDMLMKMSDKKIFEFDDDWNINKIYLPYLSPYDQNSIFYIDEITFEETIYTPHYVVTTETSLPPDPVTKSELDLKIDEKIVEERLEYDTMGIGIGSFFSEYYDAYIKCTNNCVFFRTNKEENDKIMFSGKTYTLRIYPAGDEGVVVDVYDHSKCTNLVGDFAEMPYKDAGIYPCERIKKHDINEWEAPRGGIVKRLQSEGNDVSVQINGIKNLIEDVRDKADDPVKFEYLLKIIPAADISNKDFIESKYLNEIGECDKDIDDKICTRTLNDKVKIQIICSKDIYPDMPKDKFYVETCGIDMENDHNPELKLYDKKEREQKQSFIMSTTFFRRYFEFDDSYVIKDITYSDLIFEPKKHVLVTFTDSDDDALWDGISLEKLPTDWQQILPDCIFGRPKDIFAIKFFGNEDMTKNDYIFMQNCKTDSVLVSFGDNRPSKNRIEVGDPKYDSNYCLREDEGISRALKGNLFCGISITDIGTAALTVVGAVVGHGVGAAIVIAAVTVDTYASIDEEMSMIWPG